MASTCPYATWMLKMVYAMVAGLSLEEQPPTLHCELIQDNSTTHPYNFILPRITSTSPPKYQFQFSRCQFPIRPAFAMTINKSQGGTLKRIGLDVSTLFSHMANCMLLSLVLLTILTSPSSHVIQNLLLQKMLSSKLFLIRAIQTLNHPHVHLVLPSQM